MALYTFGSGTLWGVNTAANSTPKKFGALQDVSVDFQSTTKMLYGGYQFPLATGRGTSKITGKAKMGSISGSMMADLFFNVTPTTGQTTTANDEAGTVPASSTYIVTVSNSATWVTDLGVKFTTTGLPLSRVASSPAAGQYSVAAGVYTFAAADASKAVLVSYTYTVTGTGQGFVINNQLLGTAPTFKLVLEEVYSTNKFVLTLNACISEKLTLASKLEDFMIPEFDFSAFADSSGSIGRMDFNEIS
jgi:hypothetical protein